MDNSVHELVEELFSAWREVNKKSALTLLVLGGLSKKPKNLPELTEWIKNITGWQISNISLYRMLRRLEGQGLVTREKKIKERGGSKNQYLTTEAGNLMLIKIQKELTYLEKFKFQN